MNDDRINTVIFLLERIENLLEEMLEKCEK